MSGSRTIQFFTMAVVMLSPLSMMRSEFFWREVCFHPYPLEEHKGPQQEQQQQKEEEKTMICYCSQGSAATYERIRKRFETNFHQPQHNDKNNDEAKEKGGTDRNYQFIYHSYDNPCTEQQRQDTASRCLHLNYSSVPAEGRNAAVLATLKSPAWSKCKYLVFFDDDAYLLKTTSPRNNVNISVDDNATKQAWIEIHDHLLNPNTTYPLIAPLSNYDFVRGRKEGSTTKETTYQSCVDEVWWAIRHDHVDFVYPLSTIGRDNFWLTNVAMWYVMEKCFPAGVLVDHRWSTLNRVHRYRSRKRLAAAYLVTNRNEYMRQMLERDYNELGPWNVTSASWLKHGCTTKLQPSIGVHPQCKSLSEKRLQKWMAGEFVP